MSSMRFFDREHPLGTVIREVPRCGVPSSLWDGGSSLGTRLTAWCSVTPVCSV